MTPAAEPAKLLERVEGAARDWGMRPETPEAKFAAALMAGIGWNAQISLRGQETLQAIVKEGRDAAEAELKRAKELAAAVNRALAQVRNGIILNEIEKERVLQKLMSDVLPSFVQKLAGSQRYRPKAGGNDRRVWYAAFGFVGAAAIFSGGYGLRVWGDSEAITVAKQCYSHLLPPTQGHVFCDVTALQPPKR